MKKLLASLLVSISGSVCWGQSTINLSLEEAIEYSIKNKPSAKIAALDVAIASEKLQESKRRYITDVTSDFTIQYNPTIQTSIIPIGQFNAQNPTNETRAVQFGQPWSNSAGIRAKQTIFDPALNGELKERKLELSLAEQSILTQKEKLIYEVSKSYYALALANEELKFAASDTLRAWRLYQVVSDRLMQGQVKPIDQKQAEFNLEITRYNWMKANANVDNAVQALLFQTGLSENQSIILTTNFSNFDSTGLQALDSSSVTNRADYKRTRLQKQLYNQQALSERSKLLPVISLNGFMGVNQFTKSFNLSESNSWFGNSYINLNVQLPITSFFARTKRIQQSFQKAKQSELELEQINQQYRYEWRTSTSKLNLATKQYKIQLRNLELANQNYKDVSFAYQQGQALASQLQQAETNVKEVQVNLITAMYQILLSRLELEKLQGFVLK